ncbi:MAG: hypothetical protein JNK29_10220 [Anaerolineales bacterium]|nr:hypothetical protein [Anaerolineales bacterium]
MFQSLKRFGRAASLATLALALASASLVLAQSTTKSLSTNFTLVNLASTDATVNVQYLKEDGSAWAADSGNTSFTVTANGGQKIVAQYFDSTLTAGRGSAVINSSQPLGSLVQIQARPPQVSTFDSYVGSSSTATSYFLPLVIRRGVSASGTTNSQIMIQNADSVDVTVDVAFATSNSATPATFNKSIGPIKPGATYYYDLDQETGLSGTPWLGSAVVTAQSSRKIIVIVNLFLGGDGLQTYSGFPSSSVGTKWYVPQFTSRLTNGLSTPVSGQNLSGGTIAANAITLDCTTSIGNIPATFQLKYASSVPANGGFSFNPVVDTAIPTGFSGSCVLNSPANVVVFVQMRRIGTQNNATYPAINASVTDTKAFAPLISKRQGNGFATTVTLQNLSNSTANVTLTYTPGATYPDQTVHSVTVQILANQNRIESQRAVNFSVGAWTMPDGWFGTLTADSDQPLGGFQQLTNTNDPAGDTFGAFPLFTQP